MGLLYPYRESKQSEKSLLLLSDVQGVRTCSDRPDGVTPKCYSTHQASGRAMCRPDGLQPGTCRTRQASGRGHAVRTDYTMCCINPLFPNSCDVLVEFADIRYLSCPY